MVHEINPRGAIALDGRLRSGDVILKVNDLDFTSFSFSSHEAITALRSIPWSVPVIRLLVFRDEEAEDAQHYNQTKRMINKSGNNTLSDQLLLPNNNKSSALLPSNNSKTPSTTSVTCSQSSIPAFQLDTIHVELSKKSGKGLGLSITSFINSSGVFVSQVMPGGVADSDGGIIAGDHILEVNGKDVRNSSINETALILKVRFLFVILRGSS